MTAFLRFRALLAAGILLASASAARADTDDGLPNVFISPAGKPFRAASGAPYPVVDWFHQADADGDGRLDRAEFLADSAAFFQALDADGDAALDGREVARYEHQVAPEILGVRLQAEVRGRLWLAQYGGDFPAPRTEVGPSMGVDPGGGRPKEPTRPRREDGFGQGAAPFGLLGAAEPVTSGDPDFLFRGRVRKASFMEQADRNFGALDRAGAGYLTLAGLPKTPIQTLIEEARRRHGLRP